MLIRLHGNATAELQRGRTWATGQWCPDGQDASSRPHRLHASLEGWQEDLVVGLRTTMLLLLDALLTAVRGLMKPTLTRSAQNNLDMLYEFEPLAPSLEIHIRRNRPKSLE